MGSDIPRPADQGNDGRNRQAPHARRRRQRPRWSSPYRLQRHRHPPSKPAAQSRPFRQHFAGPSHPRIQRIGQRFFHRSEVRDIIALLQVLDNQQQDIPLASFLRGPLAGLPSPDECSAQFASSFPRAKIAFRFTRPSIATPPKNPTTSPHISAMCSPGSPVARSRQQASRGRADSIHLRADRLPRLRQRP